MLPLRFPIGWQVASILLLFLVLAAAVMPSFWMWPNHGPVRFWFASFDKWAHAITFAFLAVWFAGQYRKQSYWRVGLGLFLFGLFIELCQRFIQYRSAEWLDVAADFAGIAAGLAAAMAGLGGWALHAEAWYAKARESS